MTSKVSATPVNTKLRLKRQLASLYETSPIAVAANSTSTLFAESPCVPQKEIKGFLTFDEDTSDSGFVDYDNTKVFNDDSASSLFDISSIFECGESKLDTKEDSASKRMRIVHDKFDEINILTALEKEHEDAHQLIGDKSIKPILPILKQSKHRDLASISPKTLADLLNGKYDSEVTKYVIIDGRYPYEYEGGHIEGALNLYLKDKLFEYLFNNPIKVEDANKRLIVVFHCEFSSERGPRLMRDIRERDRMLNKNNYPFLFYPELYLLEGGYKNFFESNQELCLPKSYKPMLHDDHKNDLKFFRKKSKSWDYETRKKSYKTKLEF